MLYQRSLPALLLLCVSAQLNHAADPVQLPNGLAITPQAAPRSVLLPLNPGPAGRANFDLGYGVTTAISPDGTQLLVLTSGYNKQRGDRSGAWKIGRASCRE